ncbi:MAG: TonB-dependent receptor [Nitrosomonadales bacterium]|nr:TonB-dependent receptor [Nitrosomonadales bacterium]
MRMPQRKALCLLLSMLWSCQAAAQSAEEDLALAYGDKSNISIATGSSQPLTRAPAIASVITVQDIKSMGATSLDQVLESVPGVHVSRFSMYNPNYQFRGITGPLINPQVLMLQNGVPVNSLYRGDRGQTWGGLPLDNVARVEIIRGPGSALYGADAFSGVINIITKTAADIRGTEYGVRAGSFNSRDAWVQHGGELGSAQIAAYLRVGKTDGFKETITRDAATRFGSSLTPGPAQTGYDAIDASLDLALDKWHLRTAYKLRSNLGMGAGVTSVLDPVGKERSQRITSDLSWDDAEFAQNWGIGFTGSWLAYSEEASNYNMFPPGTTLPTGTFPNGMIGSPGRWERQIRASSYALYSGFTDHSLRLGVGHDDLDLYKVRTVKNFLLNTTPGPLIGVPIPTPMMDYSTIQPHITPHRRLNDYFYVQDEWRLAHDWTMTAGVRHDSFSDFGNTTNPRLALVWNASLDLTAKLLYGQAFRTPAFGEAYGINPVTNGNPNLRPESIKTLEAGISWQARTDTLLNLNLFQYNTSDTIRAMPNPVAGTGTTYQNTGKHHGDGLELEGIWDAGRTVRLTGNYSYQQSIDESTQTDVGYAPHNQVYTRVDWRIAESWLLSPQIKWVADRRRAAGDIRPNIPDYTTLDLTVRNTRDKGNWDIAVSAYNLLSATVLEPSQAPGTAIPNDLPMARRSIWLQATYRP